MDLLYVVVYLCLMIIKWFIIRLRLKIYKSYWQIEFLAPVLDLRPVQGVLRLLHMTVGYGPQ